MSMVTILDSSVDVKFGVQDWNGKIEVPMFCSFPIAAVGYFYLDRILG